MSTFSRAPLRRRPVLQQASPPPLDALRPLVNNSSPSPQVNALLPPKLQRRGLVFKCKLVTMERVWWVTMERINGYYEA